ncbi:MAG TPA: hypothetical protein VH042_04900 [Solirubrobacterales bacterium]|jgi:hypothetical protein|nr:hypothetical protein [Solirubrobacterales bacterium]
MRTTRTTRGLLAVLVGIAAGLGAVAYAAAPHHEGPTPGSAPKAERSQGVASLPKPKITMHPEKLATSTNAKFSFTVRAGKPRFQCRLDGRPWSACQAPASFSKLAAGSHSFSVRSSGPRGKHSKTARFRWQVLEPKDFSIVPQLGGLGALYPGAPAQALPLTLTNPNPVPILVTSLQVRATADPPGCGSAENLVLNGSSASSAAPIKVPANGSVSLPAAGASAPSIQLRDLPVSQDACQRAQFPLAFSGTARG